MTTPTRGSDVAKQPNASRPLRIVVCGSVDEGRRSALGRLACAPGASNDDTAAASRSRRLIVVHAPHDAHRTRNMAMEASIADVAIVVVDMRDGITSAVRRDSLLLALLRIPHVVLVVDAIDGTEHARAAFADCETAYRAFAHRIGLAQAIAIPISTVHGDNVAQRSGRFSWYAGPTLMTCLDGLRIDDRASGQPFRMPVQSVRSSADRQEVAGTVATGTVNAGDALVVQPAGRACHVRNVAGVHGDLPYAAAHADVVLTVEAADVHPGDVLCAADMPVAVADQFEVSIVWAGAAPLLRGRSYPVRLATKRAHATISPIKYRIGVDSLEHIAADTLAQDEFGVADLELDRPIAVEHYAVSRHLGALVLMDAVTNDAVGFAQIRFALHRSHNVHRQPVDIDRAARAAQKSQRPCVLWFTGLSGAGKSTIANLLEMRLHALGRHTYLLDGDNVRKGLNKDLGFTAQDRVENIRRIAEVAALMADAGLIVLTAFISPFRNERTMARALVPDGDFLEIFVDTPLEVAERRDPKGLYRKARRGELRNFTGIDSPYEAPETAEIRIDAAVLAPDVAADRILEEMRRRGIIGA
jgi:bifunctional enzyme CysN/CysC